MIQTQKVFDTGLGLKLLKAAAELRTIVNPMIDSMNLLYKKKKKKTYV